MFTNEKRLIQRDFSRQYVVRTTFLHILCTALCTTRYVDTDTIKQTLKKYKIQIYDFFSRRQNSDILNY